MAANAAELLDGTGWLPRLLRVPGVTCVLSDKDAGADDLATPPLPPAAE
jgi:hypothetical protein